MVIDKIFAHEISRRRILASLIKRSTALERNQGTQLRSKFPLIWCAIDYSTYENFKIVVPSTGLVGNETKSAIDGDYRVDF